MKKKTEETDYIELSTLHNTLKEYKSMIFF